MTAKFIILYNQKGGVAKTAHAVTIAHGLAIKGHKTLLIDWDPQGNDAMALGMDAEPALHHAMTGKKPMAECIRETGRANLYLLPGNQSTRLIEKAVKNNAEFEIIEKSLECILKVYRK